jgi:hypothetical protein
MPTPNGTYRGYQLSHKIKSDSTSSSDENPKTRMAISIFKADKRDRNQYQ